MDVGKVESRVKILSGLASPFREGKLPQLFGVEMTYFTRTKTGRLSAPKNKLSYEEKIERPLPELGTFAHKGRSISAGTVGKVIEVDTKSYGEVLVRLEFLDGTTEGNWNWFTTPIPYEAVQEVKDFYVADGRPERIKVSW